ncbi:cation:proton antiporter [soil metagenome]
MTVTTLGLILLVACLVAIASRRLRLPYSVGLVAAGIGLSLARLKLDLPLTPELIFTVFLPPLVFEAALQIRWKPFRRDLPVTLTLAFLGVPLGGAVVAGGMHHFLHWSWMGSALFGVLIAATDPVAVIAAFKELKVEPRLSLLVESESLLNDGVAAVGFAILIGVAQGGHAEPAGMALSLLWTVLGGVAGGAAVAGAALLVAGRTSDHLVEITLTTIAAYGSFLLAEHFHMSGVLASLTAGLIVGNVGWMGPISDTSRDHMISFWDYAAFLANSVIFILMGSRIAESSAGLFSLASLTALWLVMMGRAAAVYLLSWPFRPGRLKIDIRHQHVLVWGGLRGALALALALAVPESVPERAAIVLAAFAVVAFSIFVQGLTMQPLMRALKLILPPDPTPVTEGPTV